MYINTLPFMSYTSPSVPHIALTLLYPSLFAVTNNATGTLDEICPQKQPGLKCRTGTSVHPLIWSIGMWRLSYLQASSKVELNSLDKVLTSDLVHWNVETVISPGKF